MSFFPSVDVLLLLVELGLFRLCFMTLFLTSRQHTTTTPTHGTQPQTLKVYPNVYIASYTSYTSTFQEVPNKP